MSRLKRLIHEIHRRSLWQVLGIYLVGSWIAFQGVEALVSGLGLPEWVPGFAVVLLVIGLPIVMATAFVQEGVGREGPPAEAPGSSGAAAAPEREDGSELRRLFNWRNASWAGSWRLRSGGSSPAPGSWPAGRPFVRRDRSGPSRCFRSRTSRATPIRSTSPTA